MADDTAVGWIEEDHPGGDAGAGTARAARDRGERRRSDQPQYREQHRSPAPPTATTRRATRHAARRSERRVLAQDRALQLAQLRSWLQTELLHEPGARVAIDRERLLLPPGAIEREHLLGAEFLAQWMLAREGIELGDQLVMTVEAQLRLDPRFDGAEAQLLQSLERDPRAAVELDVGERAPAPQTFGFTQAVLRELRIAGGPAAVQQRLEAIAVQLPGIDPQPVAGRLREQALLPQHLAQARDLVRERMARGLGRLIAPQLLEQLLARHDAVGIQQQDGEQRALPRAADREQATVLAHLEPP